MKGGEWKGVSLPSQLESRNAEKTFSLREILLAKTLLTATIFTIFVQERSAEIVAVAKQNRKKIILLLGCAAGTAFSRCPRGVGAESGKQ